MRDYSATAALHLRMTNRLPDPTNAVTRPAGFLGVSDPAPDRELDDLLLEHPWLETLEPFYVAWELVWPL